MDVDKIKRISSEATFEELIAAAFIVATLGDAKKLECVFPETWKRFRQAQIDKIKTEGKLSWTTRKK